MSPQAPIDEDQVSSLQIIPGWEEEWEQYRDYIEPKRERRKRFGEIYEIYEREWRYEIVIEMPEKVPVVKEKFKYGLPDEMPDYLVDMDFEDRFLNVELEVPGPDDWNPASPDDSYERHDYTNRIGAESLKLLAGRIGSFPEIITKQFEFPEPIKKAKWRYENHTLEIRALKENAPEDARVWEKFYILPENCTGCYNCFRVCPTEAISGSPREIHDIDPELCINCGACGYVCPFDAIEDQFGDIHYFEDPGNRSKAKVIDELCTGCEFCVDICPFDCIWMEDKEDEHHYKVAVVDQDSCTSCKLCEDVCIKESIVIPRDQKDKGEHVGNSFKPLFESEAWRDHGMVPPSQLEEVETA